LVEIVAGICIRHSDKRTDSNVPTLYVLGPHRREIRPRPVSADAVDAWRI
jgi:hypothetical protein